MSDNMLTLKLLSPLALHQRRSSEQFAPTLDYIPGSALRGALAELYLGSDHSRSQETLFQQIFLSEAVQFSDFLPGSGQGGELTYLQPLSALACKRFEVHYSGSLTDGLLRAELIRVQHSPDLADFEAWKTCPECEMQGLHETRDRKTSAYYVSVEKREPIHLRRRMIAGASIQRKTRTAAQGMLFSHEVIEESSQLEDKAEVYFHGVIALPDELRQPMKGLTDKNPEFTLGYGRTRGLGLLRVVGWDTPRRDPTPLEQRWKALNQAAVKLWEKAGLQPPGQYFTLTLQSHLILRDEAGQPVLGNIQASHLGLPGKVERGQCILQPAIVSGWNMAGERPKADVYALQRGSVLLFYLPPEADAGPALARLQQIEQEGAGERRSEGYGRMTACDPFHYYFTQRELG